MFNVYLNDGGEIPQEDQACYIIGKDGIYLKKNLGLINSVTRVDKISFLEPIQENVQLNIPKLPARMAAKIQAFFKDICRIYHGSEAIVLLYYNQEINKFKLIVPPQKVSMGYCDFVRNISMAVDGYNLVGDIHSHGNGSAFHSTTDDDDEKIGADGLHITFGFVDQDQISIASSITAGGMRFVVTPSDYINKCIEYEPEPDPKSYRKIYVYENGKMVEKESKPNYSYSYSYLKTRYVIDIKESNFKYPAEWLDNVEYAHNVETRSSYASGAGKRSSSRWTDNEWEKYFDSLYGGNYSLFETGRKYTPKKHDPCKNCPFKDHKIEMQKKGEPKDPKVETDTSEDIEKLVENTLTSPEFLHGQTFEEGHHKHGEKIPKPDRPEPELPSNLKDKPKSWISSFLREKGLFSERKR